MRGMGIVFVYLLPILGVFLVVALALRSLDHIRGKKGATSRATLWIAAFIAVYIIADALGVLLPALQSSNYHR